jgi:ribonuclease HII
LASVLSQVRDSKVLSPRWRARLFPLICDTCQGVGVGLASARFIDRFGIVPATHQAMRMALHNLPIVPQELLIDALTLPGPRMPQRALVKGDVHVLSIAAASIVAKVFRDRIMAELDAYAPGYGFASHKGYGTLQHRAALEQLGPCMAHRLSYAPLRELRARR